MFVVVTMVAIWLGWQCYLVRQRDSLRTELGAKGVVLIDREEWQSDGFGGLRFPLPGEDDPPPLSWVRRLAGDRAVGAIFIAGNSLTEAEEESLRRWFPEAHPD